MENGNPQEAADYLTAISDEVVDTGVFVRSEFLQGYSNGSRRLGDMLRQIEVSLQLMKPRRSAHCMSWYGTRSEKVIPLAMSTTAMVELSQESVYIAKPGTSTLMSFSIKHMKNQTPDHTEKDQVVKKHFKTFSTSHTKCMFPWARFWFTIHRLSWQSPRKAIQCIFVAFVCYHRNETTELKTSMHHG